MFIGVSMQLQAVFKYFLSHTVGRLPLKKEKKRRKGKEKQQHGIELSSRVSISNLLLKSQIPYPSPTVTLCEQFLAFINPQRACAEGYSSR